MIFFHGIRVSKKITPVGVIGVGSKNLPGKTSTCHKTILEKEGRLALYPRAFDCKRMGEKGISHEQVPTTIKNWGLLYYYCSMDFSM